MSSQALADVKRPAQYSEAEWDARVQLACCYRLIDHFGLTDLVYNHITVRLPDDSHDFGKEIFLINGFGLHYSEITASNLIRVDMDGVAQDESDYPVNGPGYVIHSAIHGARHDVVCIIHTHSLAGCAVSSMKQGLVPLDQQSMMFHNRITYHDLEGIATDLDEQSRLIDDLGDKNAMILRNHGLLTVGRSVGEAFRRLYYLERACKLQVQAMQSGAELLIPSDKVAEHTAQQWDHGLAQQGTVNPIEWPALMRLMQRKDPSFMT